MNVASTGFVDYNGYRSKHSMQIIFYLLQIEYGSPERQVKFVFVLDRLGCVAWMGQTQDLYPGHYSLNPDLSREKMFTCLLELLLKT